MKHKTYKFIFLIGFLVILSFGLWQSCHADQQLLLNYPDIEGAMKPGYGQGETTDLPQIIKYIYLFSLGIVGVVALLSMIIGAAQYVMSAGNASKASDAKDRIFSAILGIIILVASVLILRTINPDLVNIGFVLPTITPPHDTGGDGDGGTANYVCLCCCGNCTPIDTYLPFKEPWGVWTTCKVLTQSTATFQCTVSCIESCNDVTPPNTPHSALGACP